MLRSLLRILSCLAAVWQGLTAGAVEPQVAELSFDRRFENATALAELSKPEWLAGVEQQDGAFLDDPRAWRVPASAPEGAGQLTISVDREKLRFDLVAAILFRADEGADLAVQLFDGQGRVVVLDLFGNLADVGKEARTDTFVIPLQKYPTAEKIVVRRIRGPVEVYGMVLYPVVTEGEPVQGELEKLAQTLGDPLSPANPLLKSLQTIANRAKVNIAPAAAGFSPPPPVAPMTQQLPRFPRPIAILVEDCRGGSDIANEYNFGSAQLARILAAHGARVESTVAVEEFNPRIGLTRALFDRYQVIIFNGRFAQRDTPYDEAEIRAIADWVRAGGGLLVLSPAHSFGDGKNPFYLNPILEPFGLRFGDRNIKDIRPTTKLRGSHPAMRGLTDFCVINGVCVVGPPTAEEIAWVDRDCVMVALRVGKGRVIAFGGGTALMNQALNSKIIKHSKPRIIEPNTILAVNLAGWLAELAGAP